MKNLEKYEFVNTNYTNHVDCQLKYIKEQILEYAKFGYIDMYADHINSMIASLEKVRKKQNKLQLVLNRKILNSANYVKCKTKLEGAFLKEKRIKQDFVAKSKVQLERFKALLLESC